MIEYADFEKVEMRVGTVREASILESANAPTYRLEIDFGPHGTLSSASQLTDLHAPDDLVGKQVFAVTNLAPLQVATMISECLVLGVYTGPDETDVVLATPEREVEDGLRLL